MTMNLIRWLFKKVVFTCGHCGARQRIPLRRVHFFERFHGLTQGKVLLIACPICSEGLQVPTPYRTHTGHDVHFDPEHPENTIIHAS
jgi:RNase P subunit RPR2